MPYNLQNCFDCPKCLQYNGFSEDGDYNKEIEQQHYSKLNTSKTFYSQKTDIRLPSINGLCDGCNRNQEMKIIQLANFRPRNELKYDEEIEEYRQKLEDSYQLCQQCQRHLNKTLTRVKTKFIGSKISQLITKGIQVVNSKKAANKDSQILSKIVMVIIFVLSLANFVKDMNLNFDYLRSVSHESVINAYYHLIALRLTVVDLFKKLIVGMELPELMEINTDAIATSAVLLNFLILFNQQRVQIQIIISMLFWSFKMVLNEFPINPSYILAVKGSIATVLVLVSIHMLIKSRKTKDSLADFYSSFHKIHTEIIDDSENEEDISGGSGFTFDNRSIRSSLYSPSNSLYAPSSSLYSPSMTQFNSCIRNRSIVEPLKVFPYVESLNSSRFNRTFHNSTLNRQNATLKPVTSNISTIDLLSNRSFSIRQEAAAAAVNRSRVNMDDHFSNRSFSIRQEVAAADRSQVHNDINKLNISGNNLGSTSTLKDFQLSNKTLNPFSMENSRCGSPALSIASVFSGSQRAQMISPPRLEPRQEGEANTSWVAGGYWSSPQKRYLEMNYLAQCQEMSRSSSQSSGLGTTESGKNSRENSIFPEDVASIFSEPVRRRNLFDQPQDARSLYGQTFTQAPKVNNFFTGSNVSNFKKYR